MTEGHGTQVLVTTDWLAERLDDDGVVVAEVDENTDLYEEGHIPGAVKLHWRDDLQDPLERDIVEQAEFEHLMASRGIGNDTTVVLYGDKNNWFAAYAYWYLKIYGHRGRADRRRRPPEVDRRGPRADDRAYLLPPPRATRRRRPTSRSAFAATSCSRGSAGRAARSSMSAARRSTAAS